jgi:dipeptidyl-peptidase-3
VVEGKNLSLATQNLTMKKYLIAVLLAGLAFVQSCKNKPAPETTTEEVENPFTWKTEQFADLKIIRYQVPGWDSLTLRQKKLVYYLTQAGLAGRDMKWDQNYRHNLPIRAALEHIYQNYNGDKNSEDWKKFVIYTKRVWFSGGIHHHYSNLKFETGFSEDYFRQLLKDTGHSLSDEVIKAIFDPAIDAKKVNLDPSKDLVASSAVNFYGPGLTEKEVDAYYVSIINRADTTPVEYGLNSRLVKGPDSKITEEVYKVGGLYGPALEKVNYWLGKAVEVAENPKQAEALKLLIEFYKTGDLEKWSEYNIAWASTTEGDVDYIHGFIEVYNDPKGYKGSYESIVQIKDFDASARMKVMQDNAQWFEDNSTIMAQHKKKEVKGITYNVVNVAGESGDASPVTPIGVNLPNANWIRQTHGSKSVSLGNITYAYEMAAGDGLLDEFCYSEEEKARAKEHGALAGKLHTAMHEVIGHASGQINPGVGTPKETLKNYASTLEEARADLVGLYYAMDNKLVETKLVESLEVGKAAYDNYIRNGMMLQLRRLKAGEDVEEAHMRNRQLVAAWAYEKGMADSVIQKKVKDGKTYFVINDYNKLRTLFGELLKEIQRITSEGDYRSGRALVEGYGVKVDKDLHAEVLKRAERLNDAPYGGFINPKLVPVTNDKGEITDIKLVYPKNFTEQMLEYSKEFSFLK